MLVEILFKSFIFILHFLFSCMCGMYGKVQGSTVTMKVIPLKILTDLHIFIPPGYKNMVIGILSVCLYVCMYVRMCASLAL